MKFDAREGDLFWVSRGDGGVCVGGGEKEADFLWEQQIEKQGLADSCGCGNKLLPMEQF